MDKLGKDFVSVIDNLGKVRCISCKYDINKKGRILNEL